MNSVRIRDAKIIDEEHAVERRHKYRHLFSVSLTELNTGALRDLLYSTRPAVPRSRHSLEHAWSDYRRTSVSIMHIYWYPLRDHGY